MIRVLFIILSIVAALLAILLRQPLLYVLAGVFLIIAAVLLISSLKKRHQQYKKAQQSRSLPETPLEDDLSSFGIMEIRPKTKAGEANNGSDDITVREADKRNGAPNASRPSETLTSPSIVTEKDDDSYGEIVESSVQQTIPSRAAKIRISAQPIVGAPLYTKMIRPYLQSLLSTLHAHTVCLLKQEDIALHYQIEALFSKYTDIRRSGSFSTHSPLLNASEARRAVTVRSICEHDLELSNLGYYTKAPEIRQIALAPVRKTGDPASFFLLADTLQNEALGNARHRSLLAQYAILLGMVMEQHEGEPLPDESVHIRPRRDIIAEEMEKARLHEQPLALGLVYLNQAEQLAEESEQHVTKAEDMLESRLKASIRERDRIERFGQLTYGVFYKGDAAEVESWALSLQGDLAKESGYLEGGISIGIALLHNRHADADSFRKDAQTALREAYESGTCTILE